MKFLLLAFLVLTVSTAQAGSDSFVPVECNPHEVMCKSKACTAWIPKSIGSIGSVSCSQVLSSPYIETSNREWTHMYYELELLSTINDGSGKIFATKIRLKDI